MAPWYKPKALIIYFSCKKKQNTVWMKRKLRDRKGLEGVENPNNKLYNDPGYQFIPPFSYKPNNKNFPNFPLTFSATKHNDFFTNFSSTSSETKIKPFNNKCMSIIGITKAN